MQPTANVLSQKALANGDIGGIRFFRRGIDAALVPGLVFSCRHIVEPIMVLLGLAWLLIIGEQLFDAAR